MTTVDADTENTSSAQNLVIRILRDLIDEKLDWTKPWNHQNAITIAEIFTKVQEQYKNITGGTPISVDLLNTAGVTYFRNKKYTSKPDVKERKRKQSSTKKSNPKKKQKTDVSSPSVAVTNSQNNPNPLICPQPHPSAISQNSQNNPTPLTQPPSIVPHSLSSSPSLPPSSAPLSQSQPSASQSQSSASQSHPSDSPALVPPQYENLSQPLKLKEGDRVLVRGEGDFQNIMEYWPAIIKEIRNDDSLIVIWLVSAGGRIKDTYKLGKTDEVELDSIVGILPDITTTGTGTSIRFTFSKFTISIIESLKKQDNK